MIALLENEFVSRKKWLEKKEFLDILAVAESTPGPIAVNTATYIGYKTAGVIGAALSTLAVCLPSFIIIFIISLFFDKFLSLKWVGYAFRGVQVAVVYLIGSAGTKVAKGLDKKPLPILLFCLVMGAFILLSLFAVRFSTVFYILICGVIGLAVYFVRVARERTHKESPKAEVTGEESSEATGENAEDEPGEGVIQETGENVRTEGAAEVTDDSSKELREEEKGGSV